MIILDDLPLTFLTLFKDSEQMYSLSRYLRLLCEWDEMRTADRPAERMQVSKVTLLYKLQRRDYTQQHAVVHWSGETKTAGDQISGS